MSPPVAAPVATAESKYISDIGIAYSDFLAEIAPVVQEAQRYWEAKIHVARRIYEIRLAERLAAAAEVVA
jgi:hypothetical protein